MKRFFIIFIPLALISLVVIAFIVPSKFQNAESTKPNVVATFYPLAYLAEQIGGDYIELTTVVPAGVEPHDFTPTPSDIRTVTEADVVLYNGGSLDTWVTNIPTSDYQDGEVALIHLAEPNQDPHVWLDPVEMQSVVEEVRATFQSVDPDHSTVYASNADQLIQRFKELDHYYQDKLVDCTLDTIITAHDAFSYLATRYNFKLEPIVGLNPNETPSAQTLADLKSLIENTGILTVFFEELTNPKLSETLAAEAGVQTEVLSPLEGLSEEEVSANEDYFSISKRNANKLAIALQCQ